MTTIAARGWCPSLFQPMPAADGWLARIKPPRATLSADAAIKLAHAARSFGDGTVALTNRGNVQVRGLAAHGIARLAEAMIGAGMADAQPDFERRRAVIHPPLADADPTAHKEATSVACAVESVLAGDPRLAKLPAKFFATVDGGGILPLGRDTADLAIVVSDGTALIALAGSDIAAEMPLASVPDAVLRLALVFLELAARSAPPVRRMRELVAGIGAAKIFNAAGVAACATAPRRALPRPIGWLPYPGTTLGAFGVGLAFGSLPANSLEGIAQLAMRFGDSTLRATPWRTLVLPGIDQDSVASLRHSAKALGLIVEANDPSRAIIACAGRPGCAAASVDTRSDARMLHSVQNLPGLVHVSGCAKGCAHPEPAPLTLVGEAGLYNLVRNGRARDRAAMRGLTMQDIVALLGTAP